MLNMSKYKWQTAKTIVIQILSIVLTCTLFIHGRGGLTVEEAYSAHGDIGFA